MRRAVHFGMSPEGMVDLFNRPVLDRAITDGRTVRFAHDPNARPDSFLFREAPYLEDFS